jgi:hypothetical protein
VQHFPRSVANDRVIHLLQRTTFKLQNILNWALVYMPNFQDQVDFALREAGFVQIARNFYALFTRLFIGGSGAVDVIELDRILNMRFKNFE